MTFRNTACDKTKRPCLLCKIFLLMYQDSTIKSLIFVSRFFKEEIDCKHLASFLEKASVWKSSFAFFFCSALRFVCFKTLFILMPNAYYALNT